MIASRKMFTLKNRLASKIEANRCNHCSANHGDRLEAYPTLLPGVSSDV
jgi:hypothetical protein